jgi:adenine-specific DNA-methyltransferase
MRIKELDGYRKVRRSAGVPGMRDVHFKAALFDANSPIVQRRSGKSRPPPQPSANRLLPLEVLAFQEDFTEPIDILEAGKVMARDLAAVFQGTERLTLAQAFCASVIETYWFEAQRHYRSAWSLPDHFVLGPSSELEEPAASLANTLGSAAARLEPIKAGYLIGVIYTAMLPDETRSRLGVYYTPPGLTGRLLDMATLAGVDWTSCRVLDPACGGGAFLAPVAAKIVTENRGLSARQLVKTLGERVRGFEIDPFSGWSSQVFLEATLMSVCREAGERLPTVVEVRNSLLRPTIEPPYDLVIGNPPYGRVTLNPETRERFQRSLYGHANLYGLFTDLAVQMTRPGGVIAYVTPTSFLAGEYFKTLRTLLAKQAAPSNIDFVSVRKGVFEDALQETLLATYKRSDTKLPKAVEASVHFISPADCDRIEVESAGTFALPVPVGNPWLIPRTNDHPRLIARLRKMTHRLRDYGYEVSTGPLVWNRHKEQLSSRPVKGALPLIWAECVTADGCFVFRAEKKNHQPYFKPQDGDDWLISRKPCVLLQRTTAKEQNRRLIAAELPRKFLTEHGAVVIENHLNMIRPMNGAPVITPNVLSTFLNTEVVDRAFRCLSGSVAVSAYELEALPLPPPDYLAPIAELIKAGADRPSIEKACSRLFLDEA